MATKEGSLIGKTCKNEDDGEKENTLGAVVGSIWNNYGDLGPNHLNGSDLKYLFINSHESIIVVKSIRQFIVCIHAKNSIPIGLVKAKVNFHYDDKSVKF